MAPFARRDILKLTGALIGSSRFFQAASATRSLQQTDDWPQFQFDAANTGHVPNGTAPQSGVTKQWRFSTFDSLKPVNTPIVANDTLFIAAKDFNLYALDTVTGEPRWKHDTGSRLDVTPATGNGRVYLPTGKGTVKAFAIDSGDEQWAFEHPHSSLVGRTTYVDGIVFPPEGPLIALDATDGSVRWRRDGNNFRDVAVTDDTVYASEGGTNRIFAFSLADGSRRWRSRIDARVARGPSPVVSNDTVYIRTEQATLHALDAASGETQWTYDVGEGKGVSTPAVTDDTVYIGQAPFTDGHPSPRTGAIHAVNATTGERRWRTETNGAVLDSPSVVNGVVYAGTYKRSGSTTTNLYALDAATGEPRWTDWIKDDVPAHVIGDGTLYVVAENGYIHAFEPGDGTTSGTVTNTATAIKPDDSSDQSDDPTPTNNGMGTGSKERASTTDRKRGFFTNERDGPAFLQNVFNLTFLGFLLSVVGIIHQMLEGR